MWHISSSRFASGVNRTPSQRKMERPDCWVTWGPLWAEVGAGFLFCGREFIRLVFFSLKMLCCTVCFLSVSSFLSAFCSNLWTTAEIYWSQGVEAEREEHQIKAKRSSTLVYSYKKATCYIKAKSSESVTKSIKLIKSSTSWIKANVAKRFQTE